MPAADDVGRHQGRQPARAERLEDPVALGLAEVAVHRVGAQPLGAEQVADPVGPPLGPAEDDRPRRLLASQQPHEQLELPLGVDHQVGLPDRRDRRVLVLADQADVDRVDRGTPAPGRGPRGASWPRAASVCRVGGTDLRIDSTAGRKPMSSIWSASSRTTISTLSSRMALRSIRSISRPGVATTSWQPVPSSRCCWKIDSPPTTATARVRRPKRELLELAADLDDQLARRGQDQGLRAAVALVDLLQDRHQERGGLARAGRRIAQAIAAGHRRGDHLFLDRARLMKAATGSAHGHRLADTQAEEPLGCRGSLSRRRLQTLAPL